MKLTGLIPYSDSRIGAGALGGKRHDMMKSIQLISQ